MTIKFTKMHGLGNDFIVIDGINQALNLQALNIPALARRDTGVGFDQCLIVEKSNHPAIDFYYRIFNADGQEVGQCGNGARCLARFLHHYQLTDKTKITVATKTTKMKLEIHPDQTVTVTMSKPKFKPAEIPFKSKQQEAWYRLVLNNSQESLFHVVNVGNPHAVIPVSDLNTAHVQTIGQQVSEHPFFPEQTNVGFMQIINPACMKLRVYERGCGETNACGSGAVAAAAAGRLYHQMEKRIQVQLAGGNLLITWPDIESDIYLTGSAEFVYEAKLMKK